MAEKWWQKEQRQAHEEIVKHLQGKSSAVNNGRLNGHNVNGMVGGGATYNGDRIEVQHGAKYVNGNYDGETR